MNTTNITLILNNIMATKSYIQWTYYIVDGTKHSNISHRDTHWPTYSICYHDLYDISCQVCALAIDSFQYECLFNALDCRSNSWMSCCKISLRRSWNAWPIPSNPSQPSTEARNLPSLNKFNKFKHFTRKKKTTKKLQNVMIQVPVFPNNCNKKIQSFGN